jgi:hypothetical protein
VVIRNVRQRAKEVISISSEPKSEERWQNHCGTPWICWALVQGREEVALREPQERKGCVPSSRKACWKCLGVKLSAAC